MAGINRKSSLASDIPNPYFSASASRKTIFGDRTACKLRRSIDNEEQLFNYKNDYNLPTTEIISFIDGGSGFFAEIHDQVDTGRVLTQSSTILQPSYLPTGINGKPALGFQSDGAIRRLLEHDTDDSFPMTAFFVFDVFAASAFSSRIFGTTEFLTNDTLVFRIGTAERYNISYRDSLNNNFTLSFRPLPVGKKIITIVCDGINVIEIYINGVLDRQRTVPNGFLNAVNGFFIGGNTNVNIGELHVFDTVLDERLRKVVENELAIEYGITLT